MNLRAAETLLTSFCCTFCRCCIVTQDNIPLKGTHDLVHSVNFANHKRCAESDSHVELQLFSARSVLGLWVQLPSCCLAAVTAHQRCVNASISLHHSGCANTLRRQNKGWRGIRTEGRKTRGMQKKARNDDMIGEDTIINLFSLLYSWHNWCLQEHWCERENLISLFPN